MSLDVYFFTFNSPKLWYLYCKRVLAIAKLLATFISKTCGYNIWNCNQIDIRYTPLDTFSNTYVYLTWFLCYSIWRTSIYIHCLVYLWNIKQMIITWTHCELIKCSAKVMQTIEQITNQHEMIFSRSDFGSMVQWIVI